MIMLSRMNFLFSDSQKKKVKYEHEDIFLSVSYDVFTIWLLYISDQIIFVKNVVLFFFLMCDFSPERILCL